MRTALSGPAAGAVGAQAAVAMSKIEKIITLDIGGTNTDVALIQGGKVGKSNLRDIAGFRIRLPTVSDANVVLGRLPTRLADGFRIDKDLAKAAIAKIATPLDVSLEKAAHGIVSIAAPNMARAIRAVSIEKGQDPRDYTLMCFGGAGGLHAADVADILALRRILVPRAPGILCAEGLIVSDLQENYVTTCPCPLEGDVSMIGAAIDKLSARAEEWLGEENDFIVNRNRP